MRKINKIIIHCSDTPEGRDVDAAEIKHWHVKGRGWSDIGYHYVVKLDGIVEVGRPIKRAGAHTIGQNLNSIGICYIGGKDKSNSVFKDTRTKRQKKALKNLIVTLKSIYGASVEVAGHKDFAARACPCFDAREKYKDL